MIFEVFFEVIFEVGMILMRGLPQIKQITGHKSDRVIQGYIDKSTIQKRIGANVLRLEKKRPRSPSEDDQNKPRSGITTMIVNSTVHF